jgi:hypothetical protein
MSDYEKDLKINEMHLDSEWLEQPSKYVRYAKKYAKADIQSLRSKENVEIVEAELDSMHRKDLELSGQKFTEAKIKSLIKQDAKYQKAVNTYLEDLEEAKILKGAVIAFEHRRSSLEDLVKLYLSGYFSAPKDIKKTEEEVLENTSKKQHKALSKKLKEKK